MIHAYSLNTDMSQQLSKVIQVHIPSTASGPAATMPFKCPSYWTVSEIEKKIRATFVLDGGCLLHNEVALTDTVPVIMLPEGSLSFKFGQVRTSADDSDVEIVVPTNPINAVAKAKKAIASSSSSRGKKRIAVTDDAEEPKGKIARKKRIIAHKEAAVEVEDEEGVPKPEKAKSPYIVFCQDKRNEIKLKHPEASFGEMGRIMGEEWKALDQKIKDVYIKKAYNKA